MELQHPTLKNRRAFEEVLDGYQVSDDSRKILASAPIVILSGVAGGGRNTVINYLVDHYDYKFIVSDTTRPPKLRNGVMERHGVNYYFRDEDDLLADLRDGKFIEAEIIHNQQVSGMSVREVERIIATGKIPINECEFGGANAVAHAKPDAVIIGLLPPNYQEWMRRLTSREAISPQELRNRLVTARDVLENMLSQSYFRFAINDSVERCAAVIDRAVRGNDDDTEAIRAKAVAGQILQEVNQHLAKAES